MENANNEAVEAPQALDPWFLELLACPACEARLPLALSGDGQALLCQCGRHSFPIRNGIPILLVEEATLLDANASPGVPSAHREKISDEGGTK